MSTEEYKLIISGASDDLIEIEGDIREEWYSYEKPKQYIAVSDGTLLSIEYDNDGIWRVHKIFGGQASLAKEEGDTEKDTFDIVTLTSDVPFKWVCLCVQMVRHA